MGKIRVKTLGNEEFEKKQAEKAEARRAGKKAKKKAKVKGIGLKGGERVAAIEGVDLPETEDQAQTTEQKKTKKAKFVQKKIRSKKYKTSLAQIDTNKLYTLDEALELIKKTTKTKFDATVSIHLNLHKKIFTKDKKSLSGAVNLPHGTGKKKIVKIADETTIKQIENGVFDFDVLIAHPSMMPKLAKHARVLGPKGLMPNPKRGTVSPDPEKRAKELEGGEVNWKTEPGNPIIHQVVGKASFESNKLEENTKTFLNSVGIGKIVKATLASTMSPGIKLDVEKLV